MEFEIKEAEMYFIYSFMCNKAINVDKEGSLAGTKEFCEEFGKDYQIFKRGEKGYKFAYKTRMSRWLVLNTPYRHIEMQSIDVKITSDIMDFLKIDKSSDRTKFSEFYSGTFKFTEGVFKIYNDGRGICRFKLPLPPNSSAKNIVHFMDISSLPELWKKVKEKIHEQIDEIEKKQGGDIKWVEVSMGVVPPEGIDNGDFIWQTPQILLHLKISENEYKKFIDRDRDEPVANKYENLKWLHYLLNRSKGKLESVDTTFAKYFTAVPRNSENFDILNMCFDNDWYYTLSPDVLLFISQKAPDGYDNYENLTNFIEVRLLELYEYLRLRWYSLGVADELLNNSIQKLSDVRNKLFKKTTLEHIFDNIEIFLEDWINSKCIILRTFEDPSTQRCSGLAFNLVYKKGEEYFLIKELEEMVRFKLEHIDKAYSDIMDLARIKLTDPAKGGL